MRDDIRQWTYLGLLVLFIIVLFLTVLSFSYVGNPNNIPFYLVFFVKYHTFFMFLIAIFGVIFGSATQIMTSRRIESNKKQLEILKEHFMHSLTYEEKKIIEYLLQNQGVCTQYELTKIIGMNKLRVSRLLFEMENRRLLHKEKIGKINKIFLDSELLKVLK